MDTILRFFVAYAPLIYFFLAVGVLIAIRGVFRARHEIHELIFGLERELSRRHISQAIAGITIIFFLASAEFILIVFLVPSLPARSLLSTPTLNPLASATETLPVNLPGLSAAGTQGYTSSAQATGCIPGQIEITDPKPGDQISGSVMLIGSADVPNFGFYKYEYAPLGSNNWSTIQAARSIKQNTQLGSWDTSTLITGDYSLRLVVTDSQGNALPACVVQVRVIAP